MTKGLGRMVLGFILMLGSIVVGVLIGFAAKSEVIGFLVGCGVVVFGLYLIFSGGEKNEKAYLGIREIPKTSAESEKKWWDQVCHLPYKAYWSGYGIAVDPQNGVVFLKGFSHEQPVEKYYYFSDIREWAYRLPNGTTSNTMFFSTSSAMMAGAAVGNYMRNERLKERAEMDAGFFVRVRDIDMPEWQIRFPNTPTRDMDMLRWMEIFQQVINERNQMHTAYESVRPSNPYIGNSASFCLSCGKAFELDSGALFCSSCGKRIGQ